MHRLSGRLVDRRDMISYYLFTRSLILRVSKTTWLAVKLTLTVALVSHNRLYIAPLESAFPAGEDMQGEREAFFTPAWIWPAGAPACGLTSPWKQRMKDLARVLTGTALATGLLSLALQSTPAFAENEVRHVLLLSVDGFHAVDLENCIAKGTCPNLKKLSEHGLTYTNASTTKPSDSFPGMLAQF